MIDKNLFLTVSERIKSGDYKVAAMYRKSGALRGEAIITTFGEQTVIGFEFELAEPVDGSMPVRDLVAEIHTWINTAVLYSWHIMAFIDTDNDTPTPLAAEYPDLSRPILQDMLGSMYTPTPAPDPQ